VANGAKLFEVIYVDSQERLPVLVGIGDTIRATDWAEKEYPYPPKPVLTADLTEAELEFNRDEYRDAKFAVDQTREHRSGLYAVYLGALRGRMRGSEEGWVEWLSLVSMPTDEPDEAEAPDQGESAGPPSEA
jgi:hypothetical protein